MSDTTIPGTALITTGRVTVCCGLHIPGGYFACCARDENCTPCCERCPTCPGLPHAWHPGDIAAAASKAITLLPRSLP